MNISPVINLDDRFAERARNIEEKYKGNWDDKVHGYYL